jgi:DNA replication protein DnaC
MTGAVAGEVRKEMENAADEGMEAADDYKDTETGLLVCGKCGTGKQKKISFLGKERMVGCLCKCAAEKLEQERAGREAEENLMRIRQMKSAGLQDKTFYHYTFERCDASQENAVYARRYVEHFAEMAQTGQGLLFWGNVGTGKTFLAGCIANALLEQKIPVLMTSFPKILNALGGLYSAGKNEYLASLNRYMLLVIDDMGIERESRYTLETVYAVIDERYKSGKPFLITTNIPLDLLGSPQDLEHARIYDRIMERCMPVFFGGRNYRSGLGQGNREQAKKILTGEGDRERTFYAGLSFCTEG